jgi:hypothetical protein
MVGFIEPVGTSLQSAREERIEKMTNPSTSHQRISLRHQ